MLLAKTMAKNSLLQKQLVAPAWSIALSRGLKANPDIGSITTEHFTALCFKCLILASSAQRSHDIKLSGFVQTNEITPASRFHYHIHAPGFRPRSAAVSPMLYNGPIHHFRKRALWTHALVSRMGVP